MRRPRASCELLKQLVRGRILLWPRDRQVLGGRGERSRGQEWATSHPAWLRNSPGCGNILSVFPMNITFRNFSPVPEDTAASLDPCNLSFPEASLDPLAFSLQNADSLNHGVHFLL